MGMVAAGGLLRHLSLGGRAGTCFLPLVTWEARVSLFLNSTGMTQGPWGGSCPPPPQAQTPLLSLTGMPLNVPSALCTSRCWPQE